MTGVKPPGEWKVRGVCGLECVVFGGSLYTSTAKSETIGQVGWHADPDLLGPGSGPRSVWSVDLGLPGTGTSAGSNEK